MKILHKLCVLLSLILVLNAGMALAETAGTREEAVSLAKKAVEFLKVNCPDKAYAEFSKANGDFKDRDLYVVVYDMTGTCLAHGSNPKLVGKNLSGIEDADGKTYVQERVELAKAYDTFWQDYKFSDPLTKKVTPKETYCEKVNDTVVCVGFYK